MGSVSKFFLSIYDYIKGGAKSTMPLRVLIVALSALPALLVGLAILIFAIMVCGEEELSRRMLPRESADLGKFFEGLFVFLLFVGVMSYIAFLFVFQV